MKNFFKKIFFFISLSLILLSCNKHDLEGVNSWLSSQIVSWESQVSQDLKNIYLSGTWYYQKNALFPENDTWALSWDHSWYAITFTFFSKKKLLKDCFDQIGNKQQAWICNKVGDEQKLNNMFDVIDGISNKEEILMENLRIYSLRIHNAKRVDKWKVIFTTGSPQDAISIYTMYIAKIDQDRYIEIMAFPTMICENDIQCKRKIPEINEKTGLDPYWQFLWNGLDSSAYTDPIIQETYNLVFNIEKNWKIIQKNAVPW